MTRTNTLRAAIFLTALATASAAVAQLTPPNDAKEMVAPVTKDTSAAVKVNGATIPAYRLDAAIKARVAQGQPESPEMRTAIREALINQEVVAQEAVKKGLDKQPAVAARIELDRQMALVNAYFDDYFKKNPVT